MTIQNFWVDNKLTNDTQVVAELGDYMVIIGSFNLSPARAPPWRVDSVNLPCRSKVVSFLKVANAATLPPLVATLEKNVLASPRGAPAGVRLYGPND